jgi:hypothetical protein
VTTVVERYWSTLPAAAVVDHGRLPLHFAVDVDVNRQLVLERVAPSALLAFKAYPEALTVPDPVSGLYPAYQLAACCSIINSDSGPEITVNGQHANQRRGSNAAFAEMNVVYVSCAPVRMVTYRTRQSANTCTITKVRTT